MKKSILTLLGAGLLLTSCQSDEPFAPTEGGEKQVTFTLNVPGELGTRAGAIDNASDKGGWTNSQGNLSYTLVLRADNDVQTLTKNAEGREVTFTPTVVLGRNYTVTAYAYFGSTAKGSIDAIAESKGINDETKDAYTWTGNINFATDQDGTNQNITLKRPYAKLRLIATDYNEAKTDVKSVTVEYKNQMYTMFDAVEGQFNAERAVSFTNTWNKDYYEAATTDGEKTIFADYVPVNEIGYAPFTVTVEYQNGETYTRTFAEDIPVRRNALTTLKGAFFTAGATINVNVVDNFENEQLIEKRVTVTSADELTQAIATVPDNTIIYFANDITGNATAVQRKGFDVIIDGRGFKYKNGTITVDGQAGSTNPEKLTFQNINFYTDQVEDTDFTFISAPSKIEVNGVKHNNYTHNVTIQDCTFESANPYTTVEHGSASFTGTYNLVMKNCTAKNMHSLLQTQSCDNTVLVENVKTIDCKNGVSFGTTAYPTLRNSNINTAEYGVRGDGNGRNCNLKIENTTVNAKKPVIIRKMTDAAYTYNVALNGADLQTAELYHVVFTKGDDEAAYDDPTGAFTISGADDYNVYPMAAGAEYKANSGDQLNTILKSGKDAVLTNDIDIKKIDLTTGTSDIVIDANGYTITTSDSYGIQVKAGKNITIKNAEIGITVDGNYITYAAGLKIENGDYAGKTIKLENCEIRMANPDWAYAVNMPASVKNLNLVLDKCVLEGAVAVQCWGDNNKIDITNSKLICNYTTSAQYTSYCVALQGDGTNNSENNKLTIANCEFLYSGVDNFNSPIYAIGNKGLNNIISTTNCAYGDKIVY